MKPVMSIPPQDPIEAYENRRFLNLQFLLGHLRDQRPDGGEAETHAQRDRDEPHPTGPSIEIYDADRLARRLGHGDGIVDAPSENDEDTAQARQVRLWSRMQSDERGPWRKLVIPDEAMIARLAGLDAICPQFKEVTAWIVRAAGLTLATGTPLRLDPAVVVGPPGTGKTFYARKLAGALGVPSEVIAMNLMTDRGAAFSGLAPIWRASSPGKVAKLLIEGSHACPLIVIDEIEKGIPDQSQRDPGERVALTARARECRALRRRVRRSPDPR
ncbi:ATP-binding protein [Bosea sp. 47.2.35]|uniref:ATP-binding protein n=2 Tax=Boseaceae TaxID=2831100 RepID=UPI00140F2FA1|nr:ATP-binding protein [Bosea sp. 47.2.35]MCR4523457.1 ATP-binding protein [Bosea sp. 47.2.35]BCB21620.1 hypothetical protein OCUBac02_45140 [Bosea sp. ANAM02]